MYTVHVYDVPLLFMVQERAKLNKWIRFLYHIYAVTDFTMDIYFLEYFRVISELNLI